MLFEAVMAAMALVAKADKVSGNHPDYDLEDRLREEAQREYDIQEKKHSDYMKELSLKFPGEMVGENFVLQCNLFIPAYNETVECKIGDKVIEVYHFKEMNGVKCFDSILSAGYQADYDDYEWRYYGKPLNDHTTDIDPKMAELFSYVISWAIYKRDNNQKKTKECCAHINKLLSGKSYRFLGDEGCLLFQKKNVANKYESLYSLISKGVELIPA